MAGLAPILRRLIVVDTSYLLELYEIGQFFSPGGARAVKTRFSAAGAHGWLLFVPVQVIFEFADHLADIKDGEKRKVVVALFSSVLDSVLEKQIPWQIVPGGVFEDVAKLSEALRSSVDRFRDAFAAQKMGLTDTVVVLEAERLKANYPSDRLKRHSVHIWTRHHALKAMEPDAEPDAFI